MWRCSCFRPEKYRKISGTIVSWLPFKLRYERLLTRISAGCASGKNSLKLFFSNSRFWRSVNVDSMPTGIDSRPHYWSLSVFKWRISANSGGIIPSWFWLKSSTVKLECFYQSLGDMHVNSFPFKSKTLPLIKNSRSMMSHLSSTGFVAPGIPSTMAYFFSSWAITSSSILSLRNFFISTAPAVLMAGFIALRGFPSNASL